MQIVVFQGLAILKKWSMHMTFLRINQVQDDTFIRGAISIVFVNISGDTGMHQGSKIRGGR